MKKLFIKLTMSFLFVTIFLFFSGCATLFKSKSLDMISLQSQPSNVEVYIDGVLSGKTPLQYKLDPKKSTNIQFKMDGYETHVYTVTSHVGAGWVILDVIAGFVPVLIDAVTGAWYVLDVNQYNAVLRQE